MITTALPDVGSVLTVCAHPDDESFGLGAVLDAFATAGTRLGLVCITHGEASTLGVTAGDLAVVRARELDAASARLGVEQVELLDYPDGALAAQPLSQLAGHVERSVRKLGAAALLMFDHGGITGHADHQRATDAALVAAAGLDLPVLAWAIPEGVAELLNDEFGTGFVGRSPGELDIALPVDRTRQWEAIECHRSQSWDNPVLRRSGVIEVDEERRCRVPTDVVEARSMPDQAGSMK